MSIALTFKYYMGTEADQYSFYRIPKALFTNVLFKDISVEAKILYGLMLDRMGLSARNGWQDVYGRVYIYFTLVDAIDMMGFGHNKTVRMFRELEETGLIERKKQGQGKPTVIYVKSFVLPQADEATENRKSDHTTNGCTDDVEYVSDEEDKTSQKGISALSVTGDPDFSKKASSPGHRPSFSLV